MSRNRTYELDIHSKISPHLENEVPEGAPASVVARDFYSVTDQGSHLSIVVGDMANNGPSVPYIKDPFLAQSLGLPEQYAFNGGLVGRYALQRALANTDAKGTDILAVAQKTLAKKYYEYGLLTHDQSPELIPPDRRFTGYLGHIAVGQHQTVITSIEDIYIHVNGQHIHGAEKSSEVRKQQLIGELTKLITDPSVQREASIELLRSYASVVELPPVVLEATINELHSCYERTPPHKRSRQNAYLVVSSHVSPWQVITLQNNDNHPDGFAAVDGTPTIPNGIRVTTLPTSDIDTLVIHTDGLHAKNRTSVTSAADLSPTNPVYGEQTAIILSAD